MTRTKLIIKKGGYYIELPKVTPFRTPAKIDISKLNIEKVMIMLRAQGVEEYEIFSGKDKLIKKKKVTKKIEVSKKDSEKNMFDLKELYKRFDSLEELLQKIISGKLKIQEVRTIIKGDSEKFEDKDIELDDSFSQFVPKVDTKGMKIRTSGFKTEKLDENFEERSKLLSEISPKKK